MYMVKGKKVLIACEFSGIVRDEFLKRGHNAVSCDLLHNNSPFHIVDDVLNQLDMKWDLMIAFPPCTHLCVSGARWFKDKIPEQNEALKFVKTIMDADVPQICIENPVGILSTRIRKPDQIIQPYEFGHPETKKTCLWLKNLSKLKPTNNVYDKMMKLPLKERHRIHYMPRGPDRGKMRSITFQGIAQAMAEQWG